MESNRQKRQISYKNQIADYQKREEFKQVQHKLDFDLIQKTGKDRRSKQSVDKSSTQVGKHEAGQDKLVVNKPERSFGGWLSEDELLVIRSKSRSNDKSSKESIKKKRSKEMAVGLKPRPTKIGKIDNITRNDAGQNQAMSRLLVSP